MRWYYPAGVIIALLLGLGLGRILAPRYQPPAGSGEERLRARAVELYQAGRMFDALRMRQMFTPARQMAEADKLCKEAERQQRLWNGFKEETRREQEKSAEMITPDCIEVELYTGEGWGWAVTTGKAKLVVEGLEVEQALDQLVWVLDSGDWWVYNRTLEEMSAYGNPPDPVLAVLKTHSRQMQIQVQPGGMPESMTAEQEAPAEAESDSASGNEKDAPDA